MSDGYPKPGEGVRSWGNSASGSTTLLTGTYETDGEISRRVIDALPSMIDLDAGTWHCPVVAMLAEEIVQDEPGQSVVLDRLLDLLPGGSDQGLHKLMGTIAENVVRSTRRRGSGLVPGPGRCGGRPRAAFGAR